MRRFFLSLLLVVVALGWLGTSAQESGNNGARWDYLDVDTWCTHQGVFEVRWQVAGPAEHYRVHVDGLGQIGESRSGEPGSAEVSCQRFRDWFGDELEKHEFVELSITASNDSGIAIHRTFLLGLLASAPPTGVEHVAVWTGMEHFWATPYHREINADGQVTFAYPKISMDLDVQRSFGTVAVGRYRAAGAGDWRYFMPLPLCWEVENCREWHVSGLTKDTAYEVQMAWAWYRAAGNDFLSEAMWKGEEGTPVADATTWWREHNDPKALQWSMPQSFRTRAEIDLSVQTTSESIVATWPRDESVRTVWLTSPQWPGALWVARFPIAWHFVPDSRKIAEDPGYRTAIVDGLPQDTEFNIHVVGTVAGDFRRSAATSRRVVTGDYPSFKGRPIAGPAGYRVSVVDQSVVISWPYGEGRSLFLQLVPMQAESSPSHQRVMPLTEPKFVLDRSGDSPEPRYQVQFPAQQVGSQWRLFANKLPWYSKTEDWHFRPFLCMAWDVQIPPANPPLYFGAFGFRYIPSDVPNARVIQSDMSAVNDPWRFCSLSDPVGE